MAGKDQDFAESLDIDHPAGPAIEHDPPIPKSCIAADRRICTRRRRVTVMFSDLVGYTALSARIHTVAERVPERKVSAKPEPRP